MMKSFKTRLSPSSSGSDSDDERSDCKYKPPLLRKLQSKNRSYSEKMQLIATEIHTTSLVQGHAGGYISFDLLSEDLRKGVGVSGENLASLMGFKDFKSLCLNSSEICALHTWKISEFSPIIPPEHQKQVDMQHPDNKEARKNRIERVVEKIRESGDFASDEELSFRYRMCESLKAIGGLKDYRKLDEWVKAHRMIFQNEELNQNNYRKFFNLTDNTDIPTLVRNRLKLEISCKVEKEDVRFRLMFSLNDIKTYHRRLKEVRDAHSKKAFEDATKIRDTRVKYDSSSSVDL